MRNTRFYSYYTLYFLLWVLMLGCPTISFYLEKDGINKEFTLDGWGDSTYNVFIGLTIFLGLALASLSYYFGE